MKAKFFSEESSDHFVCNDFKLAIFSLIFIFSFVKPVNLFSQSIPLTFTPIPVTDPDIISPGRGAEQWHNGSEAIDYPLQGMPQPSLDVYYRFTWNRLEGATQGSYKWEYFDGLVTDAIDRGQKLSFGIMSCYPGGDDNPGMVDFDNGNSAYPEYLHRLMQSEGDKDWKTNGDGPVDGYGSWVPNWNSEFYHERLRALHEALYAHINSSSYTAVAGPNKGKTIAYKNAIFSIDVRGYGSWGEWHSAGITDVMSSYPAGTRPTVATLKRIIDHHVDVFTDHPLSIMIAAFDAEQLANIDIPKEVTAYALEVSNGWGKLGWRRDSWGATDPYLEWYLKDNQQSFGTSGLFNAIIMDRWKYAPITGEPPRWMASLNGVCAYDDLVRQVREYHVTSVGNGNFGTLNPPDCVKENIRSAFKAAGYRIILESGIISSSLKPGAAFALTLNWKNTGLAPTYEKWDVVFELKDSSDAIAWSGISTFSPGRKTQSPGLLPSPDATLAKDIFVLPASVSMGNYQLNVIIKDPTGYRAPLPLAISGRNTDGSYTLTNIKVGTTTVDIPIDTLTTTPPTIPPVVPPTSPESNGSVEKIWSINPSPSTHEDGRPVELGVKFTSSVPGFINGIRFFSANDVSGTYTGHLWTADGTLLATAIFTNVTADGWQEVLFDEPVPIDAATTYVASYHTSSGFYVATTGGLTDPVHNGYSLSSLGTTTQGENGVYTYEESGFPSYTHNATNYWVDVIFSPGTDTQLRSTVTAQATEKTVVTENKPQPTVDLTTNLGQNYPNPFSSETIISFTIAKPADVNLSLFDINGRLLKVLVNGRREAGSYTISFKPGSIGKGLYFYNLRAGNYSATKRMLVQ